MNSKLSAIALAAVLALSGCANMTRNQQRVLSGAAIGATGGAAGENLLDCYIVPFRIEPWTVQVARQA